MKRTFLIELLRAAAWSLVSTGAAVLIMVLLATTFLHDTQ